MFVMMRRTHTNRIPIQITEEVQLMAKKHNQRNGCLKGSFESAREYAREHFVYGLRTKDELVEKFNVKPRTVEASFNNLEDWFQECFHTRYVSIGNRKHVRFISADCREHALNPIYKMWKACSFTTNDIVFFTFLLDYLNDIKEPKGLADIYSEYSNIHRSDGFQRSSAQWWLKNKGLPSGIIVKDDKRRYRLASHVDLSGMESFLFYYSEIAPCGVVGSFILDKVKDFNNTPFGYKQHYIGQAFDCGVICNALFAIRKKQEIEIKYLHKSGRKAEYKLFPVKIYTSTQNGRQYLFAWSDEEKSFYNYRLDRIKDTSILDSTVSNISAIKEKFDEMKKHIWGVSLGNGEIIHVELVVKVSEDEAYIIKRLNREKRCGIVTPVNCCPGLFKFEADVYDPQEMFPWLRTFICRIVELKISNKKYEELFWDGIYRMYKSYLI